MSYENGIISKVDPINVEEPYFVMGVAPLVDEDGDDLYDIGYICSNIHGRVNWFSKYKPVELVGIEDTSNNPSWWKGDNGSCSINIPKTNDGSPEKLKALLTYIPPTLNLSYFRLTDFMGYNHKAGIPFQIVFPNFITETGGSDPQLRVTDPNELSVGFSDLYGENVYFGVCIKDLANVYFKADQLAVNAARVSLRDYPLSWSRDVEMFAFISDVQIPTWTKAVSTFMWSMNAKENYSYAEVPFRIPQNDEYNAAVYLAEPDIIDSNAIRLIGRPVVENGILTINGAVDYEIWSNYRLKHIEVKFLNKSNYQLVVKVENALDPIDAPRMIYAQSPSRPDQFIKFTAKINNPDVPRNEAQTYLIYYTFVYEAL